MAGRKVNIRAKSTKRPRPRSWWPRLLQLALLVAIVAVLIWQWSNVILAITNIVRFLGWGLLLLAVALGILIWVLWRRKLSLFVRRWYRWLGGAAFILAVWGILALFPAEGILRQVSLGGYFGLNIIDFSRGLIGILRILGLAVIGIILVAPGFCYRLVAGIFSWVGRQLEVKPRPRPLPRQAPQPTFQPTPTPIIQQKPVPSQVVESQKPVDKEAIEPTKAQQDLKQVAREVWKKYGDSPALVIIDGWRLPPIDILDRSPEVEFSQADNIKRGKLIEEALSSYGVDAKVVQINAGPTVTQFGVEPGWDRKMREVRERDRDGSIRVRLEEVSRIRVKVDKITSLANDLALTLAAPSIRIEAPVPGKSVVGIEVPNTISSVVSLRGVVETSAFQKIAVKSNLAMALGKGAGGEAVAADLSKMPHLLIAGATGSGKTVCLNTIICCLLMHNTPHNVKFIMIDPKRVELTPFNSVPHLATPVVVDVDKALGILRWLNSEMDSRYQKLAAVGVRNIDGYNKTRQGAEKMPYLVLIIDELADLMMAGFDEVEHILCRLAQLARAIGIHLVVATQRPSVDVVTGLIKANFPTRISFAVTSQVDSRTILDSGGAEKLLGRGDMLYMPTEAGKPKRLQGCYVSDAETERLVYFWGSQREAEAAPLKIEEPVAPLTKKSVEDDSLLDAARQLAKEHTHISTSFLQRRLHIGYPRAARLMELLEEDVEKGEEQTG